MSWQKSPLSDLGSVGRGKSRHRPRNDPSLYGGEYPFFQTGDVTAAEFYLSAYSQTYNEKGLAQSKLWEPATLCITIAANIAETAILKVPGCFPDSIVGFRADGSKSDVRFVKYALDVAKRDFQTISKGTTQDNLSVEKLLSIDLPAPPLEIQRRIADILSSYDDLIENNTRRIAILEDMVRRLFEEWFVRFRFPGGNGEMPDNWSTGKFGDVATLRKSKTSPGEHLNERHYVPIECIGRKTLVLPERRPWQEAQSSLQTFERGDILFGAMRAYFHKVCIAPFAGITRSTCFVLVPKTTEVRAFATVLAFRDETVAYAATHSKGSTIPYAQWEGSLENMATVIPNHEVLTNFERLVSPMLDTITMMHDTQHNLRTTRDLLLPKLILGETEVRSAEEELETAAA